MNTTSKGLLASLLLTSAAMANTDDAWLQLDAEIASLSTNVAPAQGMKISGYMNNFYTSESDADKGGWEFDAIRPTFTAKFEEFSVKVSADFKSGTADLKDALVSWDASDSVRMTWGQFKRPFSYHFTRSTGSLLFSRGTINSKNEDRDNGAMLNGHFDKADVDWFFALTNGTDGTTEELRYTARVEKTIAGEGAFRKREGGVDAREELDASVGLSYAHDKDDAMGFHKVGLDGVVTFDRFYLAGELVDYQADDPGTVFDGTFGHDLDESTPYTLTGSFMLRDDVEVAVRFEDADDGADTNRTIVGLNYYQILPHTVKWMVNYEDISSDTPANEAEIFRVGIVINF